MVILVEILDVIFVEVSLLGLRNNVLNISLLVVAFVPQLPYLDLLNPEK